MEIFPAMLEAINNATQSVDFLTFVYWEGKIAQQFAEALSSKAQEGKTVRVLLDAYGSMPMHKSLEQMMKKAGVQVTWFRPLTRWKVWKSDNRTHRKILICDNAVAFTGGVGIAEEWEGDANDSSEWRETHFKIEGPAVHGIKSAFVENWIEANDQLNFDLIEDRKVKDSGTSAIQTIRTSASVRWSDIVLLYQALIKQATQRIYICTAYFNPDEALLNLLIQKKEEGLDMKIIVPGKYIDKRIARIAAEDSFAPLLAAGIDLYYYQKTMMHAKILLIDEDVSCIGSANFNHRSMLKDDEINLVIIDKEINTELSNDFRADLNDSEAVQNHRWKKRSPLKKAAEVVTKAVRQQI